jgi:hypothetical protein
MIEEQIINGKKVWIKVESYHVNRDNPNIIPTEYFTASYFLQQPPANAEGGQPINDDNGRPKLFESPVAALGYTEKKLEEILL